MITFDTLQAIKRVEALKDEVLSLNSLYMCSVEVSQVLRPVKSTTLRNLYMS